MDFFDILLLPFELLDLIGSIHSGLDSFRNWRQAQSDARIRRALANPSRPKWPICCIVIGMVVFSHPVLGSDRHKPHGIKVIEFGLETA